MSLTPQSGRAAALARRQALSQGKAALPPATERVRVGQREAALVGAAPLASVAARSPTPASPAVSATSAAALAASAPPSLAGRLMSMLRRRQTVNGKQGLQEATTQAAALAGMSAATPASAAAPPQPAVAAPASAACDCGGRDASCREQARARRTELSQRGRGSAPATPPSRPPRQGRLEYAAKVAESPTQGGQKVTGLRIGRGAQVTGNEPGAGQPVSGTQYIAGDAGGARAAAAKVGQMRTAAGLVVSGTLVRSRVSITGDEAGAGLRITGEVDPTRDDDLTARSESGAPVAAQFQRQANPHGASVFGANLGRSVRSIGSRQRDGVRALESTEGGLAITGSAVGRSARVSGDHDGACRQVTGDQYLTPARAQAECGSRGTDSAHRNGGGTAPAAFVGAARRDPVTGAKVTEARTWAGQRVTGPDVEHRPGVTGDEPGTCRVVTGTPYQGQGSAWGWCEPQDASESARRLERRPSAAGVTGDTPRQDGRVTGNGRGSARDVTGTPYQRSEPGAADIADPLQHIDTRFSVASPQRQAHLRADRTAAQAPSAAGRITGSFAVGHDKLTGNVEFSFRPRQARDGEGKRVALTGEARTEGRQITGHAWKPQGNVSGTEGYIAAERNPSERAGKPHAFANVGLFKAKGHHEEARQIVTGMVGWTAKSAAKVTLSGGAQG